MKMGEGYPERFSWKRWRTKMLAWMLALIFLVSFFKSVFVYAKETETFSGRLCVHHPEHTEDCGYVPSEEEGICTHEHDEICGYSAPTEGMPCGHEHDETCGYSEAVEGTPCNHIHDETCGYSEPQEGTPCNHVHDESCGYMEPAENNSCNYVCEWCVLDWIWNDEEGILVWDDEQELWGLGLPGANEDNPVTKEILEEMLPKAIEAKTAADTRTVDLIWDFSGLPDGMFEGEYTVCAAMEEEYVLTEDAPALQVLVALGEGETYADKRKFLNQWSFIDKNEKKLLENSASVAIENLEGRSRDDIIQWLKDTVLPTKIRGWTAESDPDFVFNKMGFVFDDDQSERKFETTENGLIEYTSSNWKWGRVPISWQDNSFPADFEDGKEFTLYAEIPEKAEGSDTYNIYVNSNKPEDHAADSNGNKLNADTRTNKKLLAFKVTIRDINLEDHIVAAANPENVKVNLFDYWVKTENPTAASNGDILDKSDVHMHEEGEEGELSKTATGYSTEKDWNMGINENHLLLFGDGLIHAGLWNKGAGENCKYGKRYAGMEGIVKNILPPNGYPELNLDMADQTLTGDGSRNYEWIKDYKLTGDHNNNKAMDMYNNEQQAYDSDHYDKNLSSTVIGTWGKDLDKDTESLQYLFDLNSPHANKKSYEDVEGLFQLDDEGYYYYNMRENFAEFRQDSNRNYFILYDAPATTRTDGDQSIGNFFPFNHGSEVFDGLYEDENGKHLTSSVGCSNNTMNHHLGMTVDVEFRQPANGQIRAGSQVKPMTFQFAGDDDVWVFIDDVLVLDLGGIHSELYGTIDFHTGDVYIGRAFDSKGIPEDPENEDHMVTHTTLREVYRAAGREGDASRWKGNTFASNTSHTLKMFYLERGNYDSSIALRFNLQPLLYHRIEKIDQNGKLLPGVEFALYPAKKVDENTKDAIQCFYTDNSALNGKFYVLPDYSDTPLVSLKTDANGSAVFLTKDDEYFNFADRGDQFYVLKETKAPDGYRSQPIDVVLYYDTSVSMLSVANRWTTGAYASSISHVTGAGKLNYGQLDGNGVIQPTGQAVDKAEQENGLVVAVPLLQKKSTGEWLALYGSNMDGFKSVPVKSGEAVLEAALRQACTAGTMEWHLNWDENNERLYGTLDDLPGLANRYQLNNPDGDMRMVYGIISSTALQALGISGSDAGTRYNDMRQKYAGKEEEALGKILSADGFNLLSVDQFNRNFRSLIHIPNEQRELRVLKVDQDGRPLENTQFGLYSDKACTIQVAAGFTDKDGMLIFSPGGDDSKGHAKMVWANSTNTEYYLKEIGAPAGYPLNDTKIPVFVGIYSIYADAGNAEDGISVMAGVGRLTQTMRQYAMGNDVDITLQDITAFMQTQPSGSFKPAGWVDAKLEGTDVVRSMNLHFGKNAVVDYGLHDEDGGKIFTPFFVTDTGFIRARVQQNYKALTGGQYEGVQVDVNKDDLEDIELTNLFSLLNIVVVTDKTESEIKTGMLTVSKKLTGGGLSAPDYTKNFAFTLELSDADGDPLPGSYYFYGDDKTGYVKHGDKLVLHHDESITILGLPEGTEFTVKELPESGWYVMPRSGTIADGITAQVTAEAHFINSKSPAIPDPTPVKTPGHPGDTPTPGSTPESPDTPKASPTPSVTPSKSPGVPAESPGNLPDAYGGRASKTPDTGDKSRTGLWAALSGLFLLGIVVIYFTKIQKKKGERHHE